LAQVIVVILANDKAEYFYWNGWTANAPNSLSGKSTRRRRINRIMDSSFV